MADFGTGREKKAIITMYERTRKITLFVYQERFAESMINYACARSDYDLESANSTETSSREESRRVTSKTINISLSKIGLRWRAPSCVANWL